MKPGVVNDVSERLPPKLCTGCGEPTYVELVEDEERWPLCPDCGILLQDRPEARYVLLAAHPGDGAKHFFPNRH